MCKDEERKIIRDLKYALIKHFEGYGTTCAGRPQYKSFRSADQAARIKGRSVFAYHCLFCGAWHIGPKSHRNKYDAFERAYIPSDVYCDDMHYGDMCFGKTGFPTRLDGMATALMRKVCGYFEGKLDVYPCRHCGKWHIGHSTERDLIELPASFCQEFRTGVTPVGAV